MRLPLLDAFCDELSPLGNGGGEFHATYEGRPPRRVVRESENFCFVVDLSPIVRGHALIVPRSHELNMAAASAGREIEYATFVGECSDLYRSVYGNLTIIEHGSSPSEEQGGSCITHAHWHFLPFADELRPVFSGDELPKLEDIVFDGSSLPGRAENGSYIFFSDRFGSALYDAASLPVPQYARSLVGRLYGMSPPEWDWAVVVRKDLFWETYGDLGIDER